MPGWDTARAPTYGYHGDDGGVFLYQFDASDATIHAPRYTTNDTVGAGIDFTKGSVFFTLNGELLGASLQSPHPFPLLP